MSGEQRHCGVLWDIGIITEIGLYTVEELGK